VSVAIYNVCVCVCLCETGRTPSGLPKALTVAQKKEENKIEQALLELHARQKEEEEKSKLLFLPVGQILCILTGLDPYKPASKIKLFMNVGMVRHQRAL
jgi:hypothetical protein